MSDHNIERDDDAERRLIEVLDTFDRALDDYLHAVAAERMARRWFITWTAITGAVTIYCVLALWQGWWLG